MENYLENQIEELLKIIKEAKSIVVFTGAGISVPSGIPDFRSANGLYSTKVGNYSPEEIISHSFFMKHPKEFYVFYRDKMIYEEAKPNSAHLLLAKLEELGKVSAVVTQNIDGLHQMAGSKNVCELHGSIHRNFCMNCYRPYSLKTITESEDVPKCEKCGGIIKPDVVLYEESLDEDTISSSIHYIRKADVFIVIGTSLVVYPAAGLVNYFRGNKIVLINKSKTQLDRSADLVINEDCSLVSDSILAKLDTLT